LKEVSDDLVAGFAGHGIRILEQTSGEDDKKDFEDWIVLDYFESSKAFRPEEVAFAEKTTPQTPCYAKKYEHQVVDCRVRRPILGLVERKLTGTGGIESFEDCCSPKGAKKGSPEDLAREVCTDLLQKSQ